jgi:hypothetical protein
MSATLPKMGRPSLSGLSIKELGAVEYRKRLRELKNGHKPTKIRPTKPKTNEL